MGNYEICDFYMARMPLLPIKDYYKFENSDDLYESIISEFNNNRIIREAILVSSRSLYDSMINNKGNKDKIIDSFLKYYIRMCTRTTPYGLFSGVTIGEFSEKNEIKLKNEKRYIKNARVDSEWFFKIIHEFESDFNIILKLKVRLNDSLIIKGSRIENKYYTDYGNTKENVKKNISISIKYNELVKYILNLSRGYITVEELTSNLYLNLPHIPKSSINKIILDLIQKGFLITNLRPYCYDDDILGTLISTLKTSLDENNEIISKLEEIHNLIIKYNNEDIGFGEATLLEIYNKMEMISKANNYLQVDMKINEEIFQIDEKIKHNIIHTVNILSDFYNDFTCKKNLEGYKIKFLEKYSEGQEVPLLELIDENLGIGIPDEYNYYTSVSNKVNSNNEKLRNLINTKLTRNRKYNNSPIVIKAEEIQSLGLEKTKDEELLESFEINFMITRNNNDYNLTIGPNMGSGKLGKMFGRFYGIMDNIQKKKLDYNIKSTFSKNDEIINASINAIHLSDRVFNVTQSPSFLDYELNIGLNSTKSEKNILKLDDLLIGYCNEKFYIKSRKLNKIIKFNSYNMLSPLGCEDIFRLLLDISDDMQGFEFIIPFIQETNLLVYNPRIMLDNVILIPESWKISRELIGVSNKDDISTFIQKFCKWKNENLIHDLVFLCESDNRLLLNLKNKQHLRLLFNEIKKDTSYKLQEVIGEVDQQGVNLNNHNYATEIVVPIIKKEKVSFNVNNKNKYYPQYNKNRIYMPFDEWFYIKLYCDKNRENEFLVNYISKFSLKVLEKKIVKKWFFIRYKDNKNHIRLRFLLNNNCEQEFYIEYINFIKEVYENKLISEATISTYCKEIERYGGIELIQLAEDIFYYDSNAVLNILKLIENKTIKTDKKIIGVISIIKFMLDMNLDFDEMFESFDSFINKYEYKKQFQKIRKELIHLSNYTNDWENLKESTEGNLIYEIFESRTSSIKKYLFKMNELNNIQELTNNKKNIVGAFLHMFCNRMYGTNRMIEREVFAYIRHTLYSLRYFMKNR